MDCNKARAIILDRHDGIPYLSAAPEEHLRSCDGCQRFAKELETLASDFAAADELRPLDDELRARILASSSRSASRRRSRSIRSSTQLRPASLAAW